MDQRTGQLLPLRARCNSTSTINDLQIVCSPLNHHGLLSSLQIPLSFPKPCYYALAGHLLAILSCSLTPSLPILVHSAFLRAIERIHVCRALHVYTWLFV